MAGGISSEIRGILRLAGGIIRLSGGISSLAGDTLTGIRGISLSVGGIIEEVRGTFSVAGGISLSVGGISGEAGGKSSLAKLPPSQARGISPGSGPPRVKRVRRLRLVRHPRGCLEGASRSRELPIASPEGVRLLAQGVSPGKLGVKTLWSPARGGRLLSGAGTLESAAPGGAPEGWWALFPGLTPWARSLTPSGLAVGDSEGLPLSRYPLRLADPCATFTSNPASYTSDCSCPIVCLD